MSTHVKPTWEQVLAAKHWHPCDLATHTIAQCSADARHQHAVAWGADVLSFCAVYAVLITVVRPIERALARKQAAPASVRFPSIARDHRHHTTLVPDPRGGAAPSSRRRA